VKVGVFESEPWIQTAWQDSGSRLDTVWIEGLLTADLARSHTDVDIISTDISPLNGALLSIFNHLKMIAVRATGTDNIDLEHCHRKGITVCNVPAYARTAVAEHVFALLLAIGRHVVEASRRTRRLDFSWDGIQGFELFEKTLAVIGTGAIGRRVAEIARGFGMNVVACDKFPSEKWAASNDIRYLSLNEALRQAEVVSLHVPGLPETRHLISAEHFDIMQKGVIIINTARGDVVDTEALLRALDKGKVGGAGLDVLPEEKALLTEGQRSGISGKDGQDNIKQLTNHLLLKHPRVLVTPHCAFFTREAALRLIQVTVDNIKAFVAGCPQNSVFWKRL
jgi:D-lactate dehydrogenase